MLKEDFPKTQPTRSSQLTLPSRLTQLTLPTLPLPLVFLPSYEKVCQQKKWYKQLSRLLLLFHPLINRDKFLKGLDLYLGKRFFQKKLKLLPPIEMKRSDSPLLSVVIACYNYGGFLNETLESLWRQTCQNFEVIIVNDGSNQEDTLVILNQLAPDPRIKVLHLPENQGVSAARNHGIRAAGGKYICPLDADDLLHPTFLEKCLRILEAFPQVGLAYSWVKFFGTENKIWWTHDLDIKELPYSNHVSQCPVLRKSAWQDAGGYKDDLKGYEDWEFWISIGEKGWQGKAIPELLFYYRRHPGSLIERVREKHQYFFDQLKSYHPSLYQEAKDEKSN